MLHLKVEKGLLGREQEPVSTRASLGLHRKASEGPQRELGQDVSPVSLKATGRDSSASPASLLGQVQPGLTLLGKNPKAVGTKKLRKMQDHLLGSLPFLLLLLPLHPPPSPSPTPLPSPPLLLLIMKCLLLDY